MNRIFACLLMKSLALLGLAAIAGCQSSPAQLTYATPEDAVVALIDASRQGDFDLILPIFGPEIAEAGADTRERTEGDLQRLAAAYDRQHQLISEDDGSITLQVGKDGWEFPAPIIQTADRWRFDTDTGLQVVRERRIAENEADAIDFLYDAIAAQRLFKAMNADRAAVPAFAERFRSSPGRRDGLYWPDDLGPPQSPLGPLVATAVQAGDIKVGQNESQPYLGYRYRILTSQGPAAPSGAKNYVDANGRLTGGFAFLAWPDEYGITGQMTFMVSSDGKVFEKDLGDDTASLVKSIDALDPGDGWAVVED